MMMKKLAHINGWNLGGDRHTPPTHSTYNHAPSRFGSGIWVVASCPLSLRPCAPAVMGLLLALGLNIVGQDQAIANPMPVTIGPIAGSTLEEPLVLAQQAPPEIDTSITREYEPAVVYIPDPDTQELVPQSVLVTVDAPAVMAVDQIVQAYQGQNVGIQGYEVNVDTERREAAINFEVDHPRGSDVFQSLSSANQYSLFEAIRETLLTQPMYGVDEIIFQANNDTFDI